MVILAALETSTGHSRGINRQAAALLVTAVRGPSFTDDGETSSLAAKISDWNGVIAMAQAHGVLPLITPRILSVCDTLPAPGRHSLLQESQRHAVRSLSNAAELIAILRLFDQHGIRAMPFKGVVLAASAYGDLKARHAGDLDLLIAADQLSDAASLLETRGLRRVSELGPDGMPTSRCNPYECQFERAADGMFVELRWRLTARRMSSALGLEWVWPTRGSASLAGAAVPVMSPERTLLLLCYHGSKHLWSRLIWVCDVAQHLAASPTLDWENALHEARKTGLGKFLTLGILLADRIVGAPIPTSVKQRLEARHAMGRMAKHFADILFESPGKPPAGWIPYHMHLLSMSDRARLILMPELLRPNERDRAFLPLPGPLRPLYYLTRPLRLLLDRSARS